MTGPETWGRLSFALTRHMCGVPGTIFEAEQIVRDRVSSLDAERVVILRTPTELACHALAMKAVRGEAERQISERRGTYLDAGSQDEREDQRYKTLDHLLFREWFEFFNAAKQLIRDREEEMIALQAIMERATFDNRVVAAIYRLPHPLYVVIERVFLDGVPADAAANELCIGEELLWDRLSRARQYLEGDLGA